MTAEMKVRLQADIEQPHSAGDEMVEARPAP
jgi:hypothetical protein